MKAFLLSLFALCWIETTCRYLRPTHFSILEAMRRSEGTLRTHTRKPAVENDPMGIVGQITSAAHQKMALVQKVHEATVAAARKNLSTLLQQESMLIANGISKYDADLFATISKLQEVVAVANRTLNQTLKSTTNGRWDDPSGMERAETLTQLDGAKICIANADRERTRNIEDANTQSLQLLGNGVEKLSLKLGDLSELVSKTHDQLKSSFKSVSSASSFRTDGKVLTLSAAKARLRLARTNFGTEEAAAKARLDSMFEQVEKDLLAGANGILNEFEEATKVEMAASRH